jgi:hypothetical protein
MTLSTSTYHYSYGSATQKNRRIEFIRPDDDPTKIYARISALQVGDNWIVLSNIQGDKIRVEMNSISKKIEIVGNKVITKLSEESDLSKLSLEEQNIIIKSLNSLGSRCIEIITNDKGYCPFEIPKRLKILAAS